MYNDAARLHVQLPAVQAGYDILCGRGVLHALPDLLATFTASRRLVVCSDENVAPIHGERLITALRAAGHDVVLWTMPAGEAHKTLDTVADAYTYLAAHAVERGDVLLVFGGGVVGDLCGFVAATYLRGLRLLQVPTTLVAQVDSAIGGKVGVDLRAGKNMVGAFHQPLAVVADTEVLATLPEREWRAGLAEVIKHGVIRAPDLFDLLERERDAILARDPDTVARLVTRAASVKVAVVAEDPHERGVRRILNFGHTLGHAIEREAGYGVVLHGEAVAWGMAAAARIGREVGLCSDALVQRQDRLLGAYGLLGPLPALERSGLLRALRVDKKVADGRVHWVLPREIGDVTVTKDVPDAALDAVVAWLLATSNAR